MKEIPNKTRTKIQCHLNRSFLQVINMLITEIREEVLIDLDSKKRFKIKSDLKIKKI